MKIEHLINLVAAGKRPIIEINPWNFTEDGEQRENTALEVIDFSPGQRARVLGVAPKHVDVWSVYLDMTEFYELNCALDNGDHYGPDKSKLYKWHELSSYPEDHKTDIYVGEDIIEFKLVSDRSTRLLDEWTADKSNSLSYVEWLENKVMEETES